jgi:hypothetical protein
VADMPVLVSFAAYSPFLKRGGYMSSFSHLLLDSGAYSELNSGIRVDLGKYVEWAAEFPYADAWAGLDDISGDYKRSMANYLRGGFPTFHNSDPEDLLPELIAMAQEGDGWIGIGLTPPRYGYEPWLRRTLERIPAGLHVHGWALGRYTSIPRLDSFDSTHAWIEWQKIRNSLGSWATSAECMELAVKKVKRQARSVETIVEDQLTLAGTGNSDL